MNIKKLNQESNIDPHTKKHPAKAAYIQVLSNLKEIDNPYFKQDILEN